MLASSSRSIRLAGSVVRVICADVRRDARRESTAAPVRREVTKADRAANRAARKERANAFIGGGMGTAATGAEYAALEGQSAAIATAAAAAAGGARAQQKGSSASGPAFDAARLGWYAAVAIPTAFIGWGIADEDSPPARLSRMIGLTGVIEEYAKPARTKLLPDWNQIPNIPPDFPAPPCLVIDLESTLVCSTWDRKYGWRHAKRPGVDKFLALMAQYYEVVIWTPSPDGLAGPVVESLDSKGYVMHRLFRDSTNYHDGVHCKDLSWLNRPLRKIVALDDDPDALKFQPENLIRMKPYDDPSVDDDTLERITPLLVEISREGYDDIPGLLRQFRGMDADEIAEEHERRVGELRERRERSTRRGLGSFASSSSSSRAHNMPPPELPPNLAGGGGGGGVQQLTAKDLVGSAPPPEVSESGVVGWLQRRQKQQEELNKEKFELWNEVMMKKQAEKKRKMDEQHH
jgi:import inner membrane translocase subunit TIM50